MSRAAGRRAAPGRRVDVPASGRHGRVRRRLLVAAVQLVLATQAAFGAILPSAVPAAAASVAAPAASAAPGGSAPTSPTGGACTVTSGPSGALLSACPTAASYADVVSGLSVAMDGLRGASATGGINVTSDPAGATVSLNGVDAGVTPLDMALPPGVYLVRISKDGFAPFSHVVQVAAGAPTNVSKTLDPGDAGNSGSFNWVRPAAILGQLGSSGFPAGSFDITGYVRDKDGADYVSFINGGSTKVTFDAPTEFNGGGGWLQSETKGINTTGIARSTDDGVTWTVLKSWTDSYTASTSTSNEFSDSQWSAGKPGSIKDHWLRVSYHKWHWEQYYVDAMVPRADGGVSIYVSKITNDQPQEVVISWDNLPPKYCRDDDLVQQCIGIDHPSRYWGTPFTVPGSGAYKSVASPQAMARWGVSQQDLATDNVVRTYDNQVFNTRSGGQSSIGTDQFSVTYEGSYKDTDYFFAPGSVYAAHNGGAPVLQTSYTLGPGAPQGPARSEELRIGPDGTLYILDHNRGQVYVLDKGSAVLLGSVQASIWGGLIGPDPRFSNLAVAIDSGGNVHAAFRVGTIAPGARLPSDVKVYYEYFPRQKTAYQSVALFTKANCKACDDTRAWLTSAGVSFRENPTDLPSAVNTSVATAAESAGYPVVARLGTDNVVTGAADPATTSRLLGVSYPVLVDTHPVRLGTTKDGQVIGLQPDWVLTILENDQPRIILQNAQGVVALAPRDGAWTSTKLLDTPPPMPVNVTTAGGQTTTSFQATYPLFPGGGSNTYLGTARDVPFNTIATPGDLRFLNRSDDAGALGQYSYTLHTTKSAPTSNAYRTVEAVSQLIPSAAFYVALGPDGTAKPVAGELAQYVTSQTVVTDGGYRFDKVVVDLRAQGETATNGNITARTVGGAVSVATKAQDGTADTRDVSLILLVENTRLRTFDPETRAMASDVTNEAVHFAGPGEHWIVTNNIALPNSIPCAGGKALLLPPSSATTLSAAQVLGANQASCLGGLEVQPTVLAGCTSWDDAQLVLAAQTIDSLATSLPLVRSENVTNWELTFGSRDATVYRLVSLDQPAATAATPSCATAASGKSAAVVKVTGRFLGSGEAYAPTVSIVDSGATAVQTASLAQPGTLAFEREWLEFEATFLQANLSISVGDESLSSLMFLNRAGKRAGYQRQLLATRALLHCNMEGIGLAAVTDLMARTEQIPEALRGTVACLNDFALNPRKHWPEYDPRLWSGGSYDATFLGTVIDSSLIANPTLAWLAAGTGKTATDYGQSLIAHAQALQARAASDPSIADTAIDFALDDYGRLATAASKELGGATGPVLRAVLLGGQVERTAITAVAECIKSFGGTQPLAKLIELTSTREYTSGIACVDARTGAARTTAYQILAIGLRSGTFGALYAASGRDLDLVQANLALATTAITAVAAAQSRWPEGTTIAAWQPTLAPLDRMVIALRQMAVTATARGQKMTVSDLGKALTGVTECGVGLVKSLYPDGIIMIGLGGAAAIAGSGAAFVGGLLFTGFGAVVTALGASDLAQSWNSLDLSAKTAGICGVAVGTALTAAGARGSVTAYRTWSAAEVRAAPPRMIDVNTIETHGRAAGLPLDEQGAIVAPRGGTVADAPVAAPRPLEPALQTVVDALPAGRRADATAAALQVGYDSMSSAEKTVVQQMLAADSPSAARAVKLFNLSASGKSGTPEYAAWDSAGAALLDALDTSRPKSLSADALPPTTPGGGAPPLPARLAGSDANLLAAADDAGRVPDGTLPTAVTAVLGRQPYLLEAVMGSERVLEALNDPGIARLYTAEEAAALLKRAQAARPETTSAFFSELAGTRLPTALRAALKSAQDLAGSSGKAATALETQVFTPGQNKVAVLLTVHLDGASPVKMVVTKGAISADEAAIYADLGPKEITPHLLAPLLQNVDGAQALMVTEFAPGRSGGLFGSLAATSEPAYAGAIGALDARIWLRTQRQVNGQAEALFNSDLHQANINVNESANPPSARVVDFDSALTTLQPEDGYWLATLLRRSDRTANEAESAYNYTGYLDGVVKEYAAGNASSPSAAYDMLRRISTALATPAGRAKANAVDPDLVAEPADLGTTTAKLIQTYLAAHGQSRLPGITFASVSGGTGGWLPPVGWGFLALSGSAAVIPTRRRPGRTTDPNRIAA